jgi:hypothetical protein
MRHSVKDRGFVKQIATNVPVADHLLIRTHAEQMGKTVNDLINEWIAPQLAELRKPAATTAAKS